MHFIKTSHLILSITLLLSLAFSSQAQTENTPPSDTTETIVKQKKELSRPTKALILSAVIPGAGQIYNGKKSYWKAPVIIGLTAFLGYNIYTYNKDYKSFRTEGYNREHIDYLESLDTTSYSPEEKEQYEYLLMDLNGNLNSDYTSYTDDQVTSLKDEARRYRDLNGMLIVVVYLLNVFDAYVDAHLLEFEVSKKTVIGFHPEINVPRNFSLPPTIGLGLNINFKK